MIRGVYTGKDGLITNGLFVNGAPALIQTQPFRFDLFWTVGYTFNSMFGQRDSYESFTTYPDLMEAVEGRLSLGRGELESFLDPSFLQKQGVFDDRSLRAKVSILNKIGLASETQAELARLGWGYVEFEPASSRSGTRTHPRASSIGSPLL